MRIVHKSYLESYVESYLRQHNRKDFTVADINLLRKALVYLQEKLDGTCCSGDVPFLNLYTRAINPFVITIFTLLLQISVNGNRKSIQRTINLIQNFIVNPCCLGDFEASVIGPEGDHLSDEFGLYVTSLSVILSGTYLNFVQSVTYFVNDISIGGSVIPSSYTLTPVQFQVDPPDPDTTQEFTYYAVITFEGGITVTTDSVTFTVTTPPA
jgi:hypothetical protein